MISPSMVSAPVCALSPSSIEGSAFYTRTTSDRLLDLAHDWRQLSSTGLYSEPFFQPEWFSAFARAFEPGRPVVMLTACREGRLRAVLPLVPSDTFFGKVPARSLRSLSGIHSCRFDLIHAADAAPTLLKAMWDILRARSDWDVIEVLDVPAGGSFMKMLALAQADNFPVGIWPTRKSPYLPIPITGDNPFENCPKSFRSFRSRLKGKLKKLEKQGTVSFQTYTRNYREAFEQFVRLEASGWKGSQRSAINSNPATRHFYSTIVEESARQGRLRMYSLHVGDRPIAMHLGLVTQGGYFAPKIAYDEAFAQCAPGHLLVRHVIQDLAAHGIATYDFLGPRAMWKTIWTDKVRPHNNCYIFRPSMKGYSLYTLTMKGAVAARKFKYWLRGDPQEFD